MHTPKATQTYITKWGSTLVLGFVSIPSLIPLMCFTDKANFLYATENYKSSLHVSFKISSSIVCHPL
jgi:hypothetical protein